MNSSYQNKNTSFYNYRPKCVAIDFILTAGHQKIILIEGDPGTGKTTITINICKQWAEDKLLTEELVFLVPLRDKYYQEVTNLNELFLRLGCPEIKDYSQQNNGKGLVFILDGWDELPDHLQLQSFFHDIIFKKSALTCSTIIVTSRPSCSDHIAEAVPDHYYQILGFTPQTVETYIREYFKSSAQSAHNLIESLKVHEYLCRDFYIPITVVIMCFIYNKSDSRLPETLSKLYEKFVLLSARSNVPQDLKEQFTSLQSMPKELSPLFSNLCKIALRMLIDKTLVFDGKELEDELKQLKFQSADVFGLLSIEHITNDLAEIEIRYSFIHRAVQELLAAMSILESNYIEATITKYFYKGSYLINVFPFMFGLMSQKCFKSCGQILRQKFIESGRQCGLLTTILYCLFEAQDEALCSEFGQVFRNENTIDLSSLRSSLEDHYSSYFLSACGCKNLNVKLGLAKDFSQFNQMQRPFIQMSPKSMTDSYATIMAKYLCKTRKTSTEIVSLICDKADLTEKGLRALDEILVSQKNCSLLINDYVCSPDHVKIMCDTICRHKLSITTLCLQSYRYIISKSDLDSLGCFINLVQSLTILYLICSYVEGLTLNSLDAFNDALSNTKSLKKLVFRVDLDDFYGDNDDLYDISNTYHFDLKTVGMTNNDHLAILFDILSLNKSVEALTVRPSYFDDPITLGKSIEKCLASNQSLISINLGRDVLRPIINLEAIWSSSQVCFICSGLQPNKTLVSLDISGCYIDKTAGNAICSMLTVNTSLKHFLLNPVHMEKPEAVAMIYACNINATLEELSLVRWPKRMEVHVENFTFS